MFHKQQKNCQQQKDKRPVQAGFRYCGTRTTLQRKKIQDWIGIGIRHNKMKGFRKEVWECTK